MKTLWKLKRRMYELGITESDVAKEIGVSQPTVNRKIHGKGAKGFTIKEAGKIATLCDMTDGELLYIFFNRDTAPHLRKDMTDA